MSEGRARASTQKDHAAITTARTAKGAGDNQAAAAPHPLLRLQQGAGNQAVKALLGGGKPLPGGLRTEMEQRFGADFRDVRIHNDSAGHAAAEAMGAKAFTYGSDVVFSRDRFSPGTAEGRHLLAHELAHVLQQRAGKLIQSADAEAFHEFDANQAADVVVNGIQVANVGAVSGIGLAFEKEYHPESDDTLTTDLAHETNGVTSSLATLIPGQDPSTLREIEEYRKWVSETPDGGWAKNVRDSQVFIDNAAEAISMDMSRGYLVRCRGTQKGILIPFSQIDYASPGKTLELSRVYPDRTKAGLGVAEAIIASSGKGFQFFYSYYLAPEGLIAPTVFNESSSPRIFAGIQKKDEQMRAAANDAAVALTWVAVGMLVSKAASETIAFTNRMVAKPANPFKTTKAVTPPKNDKSFFKELAKSLRAHALAHAMKGVSDAVPALGRIGASSIGVTRLISQPLGRPTIAEAPTVVARPAITQSTQPSAKMQPKANEAAAVLAKEMPTAKPPGTVSASMQTSDKTYSSVLAAKASQSDSFPNEPPTRGRQMPDGSVKPYVKPLTIDERQEADKMQRRSLGLAQEGPAKVFVFEPMNPTKTSKLGFVIKEKKADGSPKIAEFTGVVDRGEAPLAGAKPAAQVGSVEREKNGIRMGGAAALEPTYDYPGGEAPDIVTVQTVDKKGSITIKTVQPNFSSLQQRESDSVLNRAWKAIFGKSWSKDASHVVGLANRGTNMPYNLAQDRPNFQNRGKKGMETWRKLEGKFTTFSKENPDLGRVEYARTPSKDNKILADRITAYDQNGKIVFDMERRGTELNDFLTQKSTPTP